MRAALILCVAAAAAIAVLLALRHLARDAIEQNQRAFAAAQIEAAAGGANFDSISPRIDLRALADSDSAALRALGARAVYAGRRDGAIEFLVFEIAADGYGGAIEFLAGFDRAGRLLDIRVLRHRETPGLGDFIDGNGARQSIDGVSGATITAGAVAQPTRQIGAFLRDNADFAAALPPSFPTP